MGKIMFNCQRCRASFEVSKNDIKESVEEVDELESAIVPKFWGGIGVLNRVTTRKKEYKYIECQLCGYKNQIESKILSETIKIKEI